MNLGLTYQRLASGSSPSLCCDPFSASSSPKAVLLREGGPRGLWRPGRPAVATRGGLSCRRGRPRWAWGRLGDLRRPVLREAGRPRSNRREDVDLPLLPLGLCTTTTGVRRRLGFPCSHRCLPEVSRRRCHRRAGARGATDSTKIVGLDLDISLHGWDNDRGG